MLPHLLVVVVLPEDEAEWLAQTEEQLILRRCGYWMSLRGRDEIQGDAGSTTVYIPRTQVFSVEELEKLMTGVSHGEMF